MKRFPLPPFFMKTPVTRAAVALMFSASAIASADVSVDPLNMDRVLVGNAGNAANSYDVTTTTGTGESAVTTTVTYQRGAVSYDYYIGTYEVTITQYVAFLNAVASTSDLYSLYNEKMTTDPNGGIIRTTTDGVSTYTVKTGFEAMPVNQVSWYSAARMANWIQNGGGSASTEVGAYTLNGAMNGTILRNPDAIVALPTADEWYKAAYYDPTKNGEGGYWLYATQSDVAPKGMAPNSTNSNSANILGGPKAPTPVGSYTLAKSYYGTFDQTGNFIEYTEDMFVKGSLLVETWGGNYGFGAIYTSSEDASGNNPLARYPSSQNAATFRFVYMVPEPSTYVMLGAGALFMAVGLLRRRGSRKVVSTVE